jgi:hypothetical protein
VIAACFAPTGQFRARQFSKVAGVVKGQRSVSEFQNWKCPMSHLDACLGILRRLIAKGDTNGISLAERAIDEYWEATPAQARKSGLRFLQQDVLNQRNAVLGSQRNFADTVNDYIEKKLSMG